MRPITRDPELPTANPALRKLALRVLGGYAIFAAVVNAWRMAGGRGSVSFLLAQAALIGAVVVALRSKNRIWSAVGDWLPFVALPLLYAGLPWATIGAEGRLFDPVVQGWDRAIFGTDPARTFAGAVPSRALSEGLHLAYLLYYAIIYVPPVLLYSTGGRRGFHEAVLAFTVTMVAAFAAFGLFPVEGPRFAWPPPAGVPSGPIRSLTLYLLENGSSRGTAFPSSHVAISVAQTLSCLRWRRGVGLAVGLTTLLLAVGAVYGGFHYAVDILAGGLMGGAAWAVALVAERGRRESTQQLARS